MDSNSETHSINGLKPPKNSRDNDKLGSFIMAAHNSVKIVKPRRSKAPKASQENLIQEIHSDKAGEVNPAFLAENDDNESNKSYIMNKFLGGDQASVPVPKPRKQKPQELRRASLISQRTFEVTTPKILSPASSTTSNRTFNVEPVGDILIHNQVSKQKIVVNDLRFHEKGDTETLSDKSKASPIKNEKEEIPMKDLSSVEYVDEVKPKPRTKKRIKIKKKDSDNTKEGEEEDALKQYKYEKIIEIIVHRTDCLKLDSLVIHPVVKIHIVDLQSGKYFNKSDKNRSVVFFYENKDCEYIAPVMSHAYNLQNNRSLYPSWEETIVLNEDYDYFFEEAQRIVIFFEILDFVSFAEVQNSSHKEGWHRVAFAFLKLGSKNNSVNLGKRMRLQLYQPLYRNKKDDTNLCSIWPYWKKNKPEEYPATIYISIKSVISPNEIIEVLRSKNASQREKGSRNYLVEDHKCEEVAVLEQTLIKHGSEELQKARVWNRFPHETCKLPNRCLAIFPSSDEGCFVMKFSNNGLYLACAIQNDDLYYISIISVIDIKEVCKFPCHQGLVYCIRWSDDDSILITSSADCTVSIFDLKRFTFLQILPHSSFVYCCDINSLGAIATGGFDGIVRIWKKPEDSPEFRLCQELEGHNNFITSVCFSKKQNLYSGDSEGVITEWRINNDEWELGRAISILELKNVIINEIKVFPNCKKILVHARDSTLRIIDLKSTCVIHKFDGAVNKRVQTFATITPCYNFVLSGSENGIIHVWNIKNGELVASYNPYSANNKRHIPIHCVEFHTQDNMLAISHYGENMPILLYSYEKDDSLKNVDLVFHKNLDESCLNLNGNGDIKKFRLKDVVQKRLKNDSAKFDFATILQKMDKVIVS